MRAFGVRALRRGRAASASSCAILPSGGPPTSLRFTTKDEAEHVVARARATELLRDEDDGDEEEDGGDGGGGASTSRRRRRVRRVVFADDNNYYASMRWEWFQIARERGAACVCAYVCACMCVCAILSIHVSRD